MYGAIQWGFFLLEKGGVSMEWELEKKAPYNQAFDVIQELSQVHCAEAGPPEAESICSAQGYTQENVPGVSGGKSDSKDILS